MILEKKMENQYIILKCDYCGKEISCPVEEKEVKKHSCYDCFQNMEEKMTDDELSNLQVDVPSDKMNEIITEELVDEVFHSLWDERKEELKDLSKKELAQFMFVSGAMAMGEKLTEMGEEGSGEEAEEAQNTSKE